MIRGLDVSAIQGKVPWDSARNAGFEFVWCRSVVGNEGARDTRVLANLADAKSAGLTVGGYFFAFPLPRLSPDAQVDHWCKLMEQDGRIVGQDRGELPPALDLEWPPPEEKDKASGRLIDTWAKWGCSAEQILMWGAKAVLRMHARWGCWPALYTYPYFWQRITRGVSKETLSEAREVYEHCEWWGADYKALGRVPVPTERPYTPEWWQGRPVFWQHDGNGGLKLPNGVDVDCNVFCGTREQFDAIVAPHGEPVLPAPQVDPWLARQRAVGVLLEEDIRRYRQDRETG